MQRKKNVFNCSFQWFFLKTNYLRLAFLWKQEEFQWSFVTCLTKYGVDTQLKTFIAVKTWQFEKPVFYTFSFWKKTCTLYMYLYGLWFLSWKGYRVIIYNCHFLNILKLVLNSWNDRNLEIKIILRYRHFDILMI